MLQSYSDRVVGDVHPIHLYCLKKSALLATIATKYTFPINE